MSVLGPRFRRGREAIGLSQAGVAEVLASLSQRDVSQLEAGVKKFLPPEYIQFLHSRGVDLNSLFDESMEVRLRKGAPFATNIPALDAARESVQRIQDAVTPEWLKTVMAMQQDLAKVQEELARMKRAEKGKSTKGKTG